MKILFCPNSPLSFFSVCLAWDNEDNGGITFPIYVYVHLCTLEFHQESLSCITYAGESISGGKLLIDVKYFGVHIHQETHDFCEETSCPVSGNFELSHSQSLPAFTPPVSLTLPRTFMLFFPFNSYLAYSTAELGKARGHARSLWLAIP